MTILKDKIGISSNIFENPIYLEALLNRYGKAGFRVIEIELDNAARTVLDYNHDDKQHFVDSILTIKQQYDLTLSLHAPYLGHSTDIAATDETTRIAAVQLMTNTLQLAHALNVTTVTLHPGYLDKKTDNNTLFQQLMRSMTTLQEIAMALGITLCLENTGNNRPLYIVLTEDEQKTLFKTLGVKMTLDIVHYASFTRLGKDFYNRLLTWIPYIGNVHFADMKIPTHRHLPLTTGDLPYHSILAFLYNHGYQGNAIIEETAKGYMTDEYVEKALEYRNKLAA